MGTAFNKIHIIGPVGSGKTTCAKRVSSLLSIPMYELDNIVWERTSDGDIRRSPAKRDAHLREILHTKQWIIEGAQHHWVNPSFQSAELIVLLDTPYRRRVWQIVTRFVRQKLGVEKSNYRPTFHILKKMFEWSAYYEKEQREQILKMLQPYDNKFVHIQSTEELEELFQSFS